MDLLTLREVLARTGLGRTTLWRYRQTGEFPAAVTIGHLRAVMWRQADVEAWAQQRGLPTARVHRDP